jgi:hypothetical protein
MESAASGLVWYTSQIFPSQLLDVARLYPTMLTHCLSLLRSRCSVNCRGSHQCHLVVVENIGLRGAGLRVDCGRTVRPLPQKKLPNELGAAEGAEKPAPDWSQQFSHVVSPGIEECRSILIVPEF